jgi:lipopolysaccharide/colanic/teichoic acid biosynthesis glycosyltransferase
MTPARWLHSPVKRAVDAIVAAAVLVLRQPGHRRHRLAVRSGSARPVLFRQARAGRDGHPIEIVKFRSMTDARGADGELLPDDQRLPRFGRLLRASSLDELPQLWNVVRGDMSLIGPRPLPLTYVDRYNPSSAAASTPSPASPAGPRSTAATPSTGPPSSPTTSGTSTTPRPAST